MLSQDVDHANSIIEAPDGVLSTNSPTDLIQILTESFQIVVAKKIKELVLKVLKVFTNIISQYQTALNKVFEI